MTSSFPVSEYAQRWQSEVALWVHPKRSDEVYPMQPYPGSSKWAFYVEFYQHAFLILVGPFVAAFILFGL